ncbi:MAG: Fe-S cluster assembly protein SufD [Gammaproteobacteria bacterium]
MTGIDDRHMQEFRALQAGLPGARVPWIDGLRRNAMERFAELGYPGPRLEDWKYTDVRPIEKRHFRAGADAAPVDAEAIAGYRLTGLAVHELVFVDGRFAPEYSQIGDLPAGVAVTGLAAIMDRAPAALEDHLAHYAPVADNGFAALNAAFMTDGAYIALASGTEIEAPIHLLFVSTGSGRAAHVRNLVAAGPDSRAVVVESHVGLGDGEQLTNVITEMALERGAAIEHYKLARDDARAYHIAGTHVHQDRDSRYTSHNVTLGGRLVRNDLVAALHGAGAECTLNGLYITGGRQHVDNHTRIDHRAPDTTSREWYKGVLDGRSRSVFGGRIVVHPDAQRTDARQTNNNLLLSRDAEADSKPQLEIYADDVKCSHGSTVGRLDRDALFYLRSRALDEQTARNLLVYAFAADLVQRMGLMPLRRQLEGHLGGALLSGQRSGGAG